MERWLLDCFMARMMLLLMVVVGLGGVAGHDLNIEIFGEMVVPNAASKDMQLAVLTKLLQGVNVMEKCVDFHVEFRDGSGISNESFANYTLVVKQSRCDINSDVVSISKISNLGISSVNINVDNTAEFWRDKMNSILVFSGCGAIVVIVLVTCIVLTSGCYKTDRTRKEPQTYEPGKQKFYHPYAIDTMTLDHKKYSRKENFQSISESPTHESTTIERWVNSQLSRGRRQSSAINMNHDGHSKGVSNTPRLKSPSEDMLTTDSGIGTTAPRSQYKEADRNYVHGSRRSKEMPKGNSRTQLLSSPEPFYGEPHFKTCNSINYIQHENGAYMFSNSRDARNSIEESSKL